MQTAASFKGCVYGNAYLSIYMYVICIDINEKYICIYIYICIGRSIDR